MHYYGRRAVPVTLPTPTVPRLSLGGLAHGGHDSWHKSPAHRRQTTILEATNCPAHASANREASVTHDVQGFQTSKKRETNSNETHDKGLPTIGAVAQKTAHDPLSWVISSVRREGGRGRGMKHEPPTPYTQEPPLTSTFTG